MLALRGIGMICVFGAAILTGRELELRLKRRWIVLSEIAGGLTLLEKDMLCHRSSLAEALQTVAKRCRSEAGQLFAAAGIGISMTGTGPFSAIWTQSVKESGLGRLLTEMEYAELLALATVLCSADPVQQRVLFQRYGEQFQDMSRVAQEQYREKGALYRKLAAAAGVFLVLLLI